MDASGPNRVGLAPVQPSWLRYRSPDFAAARAQSRVRDSHVVLSIGSGAAKRSET